MKYLRAILMWADLWDVCWWHYNEDYALNVNPYVCDCKAAWEIAKGVWLED